MLNPFQEMIIINQQKRPKSQDGFQSWHKIHKSCKITYQLICNSQYSFKIAKTKIKNKYNAKIMISIAQLQFIIALQYLPLNVSFASDVS